MFSHLIPVTRENFENKGFLKNNNFLFAKNETVCEISYNEITDALNTFPLAMVIHENKPKLVVLFSVIPQQNCFVSPDGKWLGGYIPYIIKMFPFTLRPHPESPEELLLCIEKSSIQTLEDANTNIQELFTQEGKPNDMFESFIQAWNSFTSDRATTDIAMQHLFDAGLFVEWDIILQSEKDGNQHIKGIYRIDEQKLHNLPADIVGKLNKNGSLAIAYAQLLSRKKMAILQAKVSEYVKYIEDKEKLAEKIKEHPKGDISWGF